MTDVYLPGSFFRDGRGFTVADAAGSTWAFDNTTNTLSVAIVVAAGSVADNAITNAKLADMAQATIKGRAAAAGTGDPVDLTAAQVKTILALTSADLPDFTEAAQDATGALIQTSATIAPSYNDAGNALTLSVIDGTITYAKLQNVSATNRILGRITAGAGVVEELTGANLATIIGTSLGANPTAKVGPTATNGTAGTYLRSDAAPAIDLTAAYTWTGAHTFSTGGGIIGDLGATAATSLIRPKTDATLYSLLGRAQAGPGIQGRWDSGTTNRYLSVGMYDNVGTYAEVIQTNNSNLIVQLPMLWNNQTTTTTAPGAGGAGALPATPAGYMTQSINGVSRKIAYY